jgi:hypothetical protein
MGRVAIYTHSEGKRMPVNRANGGLAMANLLGEPLQSVSARWHCDSMKAQTFGADSRLR